MPACFKHFIKTYTGAINKKVRKYLRTQWVFGIFSTENLQQIVDNTKCMPPCLFNEYKLGDQDKWDSKAYSNNKLFKLKFTDNKIIIEKEIESYSFVSLVSDIGGALGLFLGFSFVMVWDEAEALIRKIKNIGRKC